MTKRLDDVIAGMAGEDLELVRDELVRLRAIEERLQALKVYYDAAAKDGIATSCVAVSMGLGEVLKGGSQS